MDGEQYFTVEHVYQAAKTLDLKERKAIQLASTPGKAKRLGRKANLRPGWDFYKSGIMFDLVFQKFSKNSELKKKLLATEDTELVEGNYWCDIYFGACTCPKHQGAGQNILGKILSEVRKILREES
jgi:ribA/ribD-fused uncharacterized protein